jgi:hypothetical protein
MDMAAATAAVHPRASSLSHSSSCFRITTLPALSSRPAASPCSRSSSSYSSSLCSCWDGVGQQQQLRVQMVSKKSGREQVGGGGGGIVSTFAFDAEKPILYENGEEDPPTVVSAPNRRIVASEKETHTQTHTHLLLFFVFLRLFLLLSLLLL